MEPAVRSFEVDGGVSSVAWLGPDRKAISPCHEPSWRFPRGRQDERRGTDVAGALMFPRSPASRTRHIHISDLPLIRVRSKGWNCVLLPANGTLCAVSHDCRPQCTLARVEHVRPHATVQPPGKLPTGCPAFLELGTSGNVMARFVGWH